MRLHTQLEAYQDCVNFYLADERGEKRFLGQPVVMAEQEPNIYVEPTFRLSSGEAQELFERLWSQGFRSVHDKGGAKELDAARKEHIADLRKAAKLA
jgi:hypothetical protein